MNKELLINFESWVANTFNTGKLKSPVHLSGSTDENLEEFLIDYFKQIKKDDWLATTYRSHYHALLKGVPEERLKNWILDNKSIHFMDKEYKIFSSAIVGGVLSIALGIALAKKLTTQRKKDKDEVRDDTLSGDTKDEKGKTINSEQMPSNLDTHAEPILEVGGQSSDSLCRPSSSVYCIVGDMTSQTGIFHEVFKYAVNHDLPIKFLIECNHLSTNTETAKVWGSSRKELKQHLQRFKERFPKHFDYIVYKRKYPHYGTGKFVDKIWKGIDDTKKKGF